MGSIEMKSLLFLGLSIFLSNQATFAAGFAVLPCASTSTQTVTTLIPSATNGSVACPQFTPPSGQALTGISIGSISETPHVNSGWMTVMNNTSSPVELNSLSAPLLVFSVAYLDFPGYPTTPMEWPVFPAGVFTIPAGESSMVLVSGALPQRQSSSAFAAYTGSGTVATNYTVGSRVVAQPGSGLSISNYLLEVDPTPSVVYVYDAAPTIPEPSTFAYFGIAALAASGLRTMTRRK